MMQIGILGSGEVGQKLADGFIAIGTLVKIGTRSPEKVAPWAAKHGGKASIGCFSDAATFGEIEVLATYWEGTPRALQLARANNFSGKLVVDLTNPLDFSNDVHPRLAVGNDDSSGETVQRLLPNAKVVQTFNIVGNTHMFRPDFPGWSTDHVHLRRRRARQKTDYRNPRRVWMGDCRHWV